MIASKHVASHTVSCNIEFFQDVVSSEGLEQMLASVIPDIVVANVLSGHCPHGGYGVADRDNA